MGSFQASSEQKIWLSSQIRSFYLKINVGWWVMLAICALTHYQMMPPRFPAASLDDTSGEQMCSNEFTEKSGVRDMAFHYFPVVLLRAKSSAVQQEVQSPGTEYFQVFTWLSTRLHNNTCLFIIMQMTGSPRRFLISVSIIQFPLTPTSFLSSLIVCEHQIRKSLGIKLKSKWKNLQRILRVFGCAASHQMKDFSLKDFVCVCNKFVNQQVTC